MNINSGLSPEEPEMSKLTSKCRKTIKKSPGVNLLNSSSTMRNYGKSFANSARKAGCQHPRLFPRWDSPDIDNVTDYVRQNPGTQDRHRFRVPTQKLEKIVLVG